MFDNNMNHNNIDSEQVYESYAGAPVGMWTWGRVHTKFWQPP
jgi:hypothetical protein